MHMIVEDFYNTPYCVYGHYVDDELIYIGCGTLGRPFVIERGGRTPEHIEMLRSGKTRVEIYTRFTCKQQALDLERSMIQAFKPPANKHVAQPVKDWDKFVKRDRRPVRCIQTGVCYYGAAHASESLGLSHNRIHENLTGAIAGVDGMTFERVSWEESGFNPDDRLNRDDHPRRRGSLTARAKIILDAVMENIYNDEKPLTDEQLGILADCTSAGANLAVQQLVKKGYITISKPTGNTRVFGIGENEIVPGPLQKARIKRINAERKIIYDILSDAALNNKPCPSNADLVEITGSKPQSAQRIIGRLAKNGLLTVEMITSNKRIITIDGHSTRPTADHNIKGVPTVARQTRAIDRIIV